MAGFTRLTAVASLALVAVAAGVPAAPAPSDRPSLAAVPAGSPIVVHVRGVEGTRDRLVAMLKNALPEVAPLVETYLDKALKEGDFTQGRKPRGIAKDGPIFMAFTEMPKPGAEPKMAIIVAVTKYDEFRDNVLTEEERKTLKTDKAGYESADLNVGEPIFFVNKKEYAVVTPSKEVAESFTKEQKGIDGHISKEQSNHLLGSDLGVYLDLEALNKAYADQIKAARDSAREALKAVGESADKSQQGIFAFLQKLTDPAFQAIEDSRGVVLTVEFRPGGLALHAESELRPGTATAKALEGHKQSAFTQLEKMPAGQVFYIGMEPDKSFVAAAGGLMYGITPGNEDKDAKAALDELIDAGPGTSLSATDIPVGGVQVSHFADPAKALDAQLKLIRYLGSGTVYGGGMLKDKPKVTPKAQKYGDTEFARVELTWDPAKMAENTGGAIVPEEAKKQIAEGYKKLLGEKQTAWLGVTDTVVVQVTAKDWAAAEKLLHGYLSAEGTVGESAVYRDVRKELPAEANAVALMDAVRYAGVMLEFSKPIIESLVPLPVKLPSAPEKVRATFSGAAVSLKPDRAGLDIFISAPTVHELFRNYVAPMIGGAGAVN
jgi:hypothetical protein